MSTTREGRACGTSTWTKRCGWAAALIPCAILGQFRPPAHAPVPMRDVTIRGAAATADTGGRVDLVVQAAIGTPFGRVPINSHMRLVYACDARFTGRVTYHPLVRLFARVKGVDLITTIDGRVDTGDSAQGCSRLDVRQIVGRATVADTQLTGYLRLDADSLDFRGPAWMLGDSSYHSVVTAQQNGRRLVMAVNMYER